MKQEIATQLAGLLQGKEPFLADLMQRTRTTVRRVETDIFFKWGIYYMVYRGPHNPVAAYVAVRLPDVALVLTGNPEGFMQMAADEPVHIESGEQALAYGELFLTTTRAMRQWTTLIREVVDIPFLPNLQGEAAARVAGIREHYTGHVAPTVSDLLPAGKRVVLYAVVGQKLVRNVLDIRPGGEIRMGVDISEENLPVVSS